MAWKTFVITFTFFILSVVVACASSGIEIDICVLSNNQMMSCARGNKKYELPIETMQNDKWVATNKEGWQKIAAKLQDCENKPKSLDISIPLHSFQDESIAQDEVLRESLK